MSQDMQGIERVNMALDGLMAALSPAGRRKLGLRLGQLARRENQRRIAANVAPSGAAFVPRRPQPGQKKLRGKMFRKLRSAQHMRITRTDSTVTIAFKGRAARIAEVHHFGLRDKPTPKSRRAVKYPARPLLGWSSEDRSALEALIVNHVAAGLNQGDTE